MVRFAVEIMAVLGGFGYLELRGLPLVEFFRIQNEVSQVQQARKAAVSER